MKTSIINGSEVSRLSVAIHYARIDTGETIDIKVTSGRHILGISGDSKGKGLCGMQVGQPLKETATQLNAREHQKFRITGDTNSGLDIRPSTI